MKKLLHLDLFSGIGGFSLGLERSGLSETIAFCEIDPFCQKVLNKHWPNVPIYEDIRELNEETLAHTKSARIETRCTHGVGNEHSPRSDEKFLEGGSEQAAGRIAPIHADLITGGYPCQPFSAAGKRRGEEDDRHLWPEMYRIIKIVRPRWVIAENVAGHVTMGLDTVLSDLEAEGYTWWTFVIPACAVGAQHRRDRIWIIANAVSVNDDNRRYGASPVRRERSETSGLQKCKSNVADTSTQGLSISEQTFLQREGRREKGGTTTKCGRWSTEPSVGRVANGIPGRVDRLKGLGNAVVPQLTELIGMAIKESIK